MNNFHRETENLESLWENLSLNHSSRRWNRKIIIKTHEKIPITDKIVGEDDEDDEEMTWNVSGENVSSWKMMKKMKCWLINLNLNQWLQFAINWSHVSHNL